MTFLVIDGTRYWVNISNLFLKKSLKWKDVSALTNIDLLEESSKENKDMEFGEKKKTGDVASTVVIATSSIFSVNPP